MTHPRPHAEPHRTRVLHIAESLRSGGQERQLVELLKGLSTRDDMDCALALMSENIHYSVIHDLDVSLHYIIRKTARDPRIFLKLYALCKQIRPDIIHAWTSMTAIYASPVAKLLGIKLVNGMIRIATQKLKPFGAHNLRARIIFPFSDVIVANSHAGLTSFKAPVHKSVCIHNGFDFARVNNIQDADLIRKKFDVETDKVVGMVATFSDHKDFHAFIAAAITVTEKRDDVTFLAIGDGKNLEKCRAMVPSHLENRIKFLGKQQNVESIVNILTIGILTTNVLVHGEGISNSVTEYMALGKPVLATSDGGMPELIRNCETGFLLEPYDVSVLVDGIERLLNDTALAEKMGDAGRERIRLAFSLDGMCDEYIRLYQNILG